MEKAVLDFQKLKLTDDDLFELCRANSLYRIERDTNQNIVVMEPSGFESDNYAMEIATSLNNWNRSYVRKGKVVASNAGFILQDKSMRSPDVAWVSEKILSVIPKEKQKKFLNACPEFVVEVKSASDSISELKKKMEIWLENGCELAWLVNPDEETIWVFEKNKKAVVKTFNDKLDGGNLLIGFQIVLADILK